MAIGPEPMKTSWVEVRGLRMAYTEMGRGAPILFQHGNPTSRYLWRNILPELADLGRCIAAIVARYADWLAQSSVPKLFVNAEPGSILVGPQREACWAWPNQTEVTVPGSHFLQEDSPDEIVAALRAFVLGLRGGG